MHEIEFLKVVVIIFGLASLVIFIFNKLKLPSVVGFLLTGIIAGPYALGLISDIAIIDILAEIGVILLLFIIGMDFSIKKLIKIRNIVLIGGVMQVGITILVVVGILHFFTHVPYNQAVFIGFLVALSSTAIILKVLQENDQVESHHGKISLGILIFQDLIIVPMMLFVPFLSGESTNIGSELLLMLGKTVALLGVTFVLARWVIQYVLHKIAVSNSQELFLIAIIVFGFAIASFSAWLGLSLLWEHSWQGWQSPNRLIVIKRLAILHPLGMFLLASFLCQLVFCSTSVSLQATGLLSLLSPSSSLL